MGLVEDGVGRGAGLVKVGPQGVRLEKTAYYARSDTA
jgi:hypothetical protein